MVSFYTVAFVGMAPFGSLFAFTLAQHFGAPGATVYVPDSDADFEISAQK